MHHHHVRDVMTVDPVTVTPATPLKYVADLLVSQKVSAIPVVSNRHQVLGVITETDLLRKEELQRDPGGRREFHISRVQRETATAETAGEVMSTSVVTVRPGATVAEAARLIDRHDISCLLVTGHNGELLGVVSPRDLLRVFLRPDDELRAEIITDVLSSYLGTNPALVQVDVTDGVVTLTGEVERKSMLGSIWAAVRAVDGVIDASGQLSFAFDDTIPLPADERNEPPMTRGDHPPVASRRLT